MNLNCLHYAFLDSQATCILVEFNGALLSSYSVPERHKSVKVGHKYGQDYLKHLRGRLISNMTSTQFNVLDSASCIHEHQ